MSVRRCSSERQRVNPQFAHAFQGAQSVLLFSSSGAISCSHPSFWHFGSLGEENFLFYFLFLLYIFNKVFMSGLVTTAESYKQREVAGVCFLCVCVCELPQPETVIDLQCFHCLCSDWLFFFFLLFFFSLLLLSLFVLIFREVGYFALIFMCFFFSPLFSSCFFSPPPLSLPSHFTHGSCRWFSLTASLGLIICIQINYLITDKCPAATPHSGSSALSL